MTSTATWRHIPWIAAVFALLVGTGPVSAQTPVDLGEEFIFFVDGLNVLVPGYQGEIVNDPLAPGSGNKVMKFGYSDWAANTFQFNAAVGADMTAMVSEDPTATKTLYLKILITTDLQNRGVCTPTGDGCLSISFFDAISGDQSRPSLESGAGDPEMRLKWFIPEEIKTGEWVDLAIPLPPSTLAALESARAANTLDELQARWHYTGAWAGGFGVGCCGSATPLDQDPAWQEFQWGNTPRLGVHYDFADGGTGAVYFDDVYIGDENTDLSAAAGVPEAMSGVTFAATGATNTISWAHNEAFGGYNVYVSEEPITKERLDAGEVSPLGSVSFDAAAFEVVHAYELPHPTVDLTFYYAVTSKSLFGAENTDVSNSSGSIQNPNLATQAYMVELDDDQSLALFNALSAGTASNDGYPGNTPWFRVDSSHWKTGDGAALPSSEDDLSGAFMVGFNRQYGELYIYGEVKDDQVTLHPGTEQDFPLGCNGCGAWEYDSVEFGWGAYDVREVPNGSIVGGSPHQNYERGEFPDYQLRVSNLATGATSVLSSGLAGRESEAEFTQLGAGAVFGDLTDDQGNVIGYKFLALYYPESMVAQTSDTPITWPESDEIKLIPFNIAINDADGGPRNLQVQWSTKPNADSQWWNTPAQWLTVAVVGNAVSGVDSETMDELPAAYALEQNFPNPFNPTTTIAFTLAQPQRVQLTLFNLLGQKVGTLIGGDLMGAGRHQVQLNAAGLASGTYLMRLEAGSAFTQTRSLVLMK